MTGKQSKLLDGVSFFTLRRYVSETIQGARTALFAREGSAVVGEWVTPILRESRGPAKSFYVDVLVMDLSNPSRRCVLHASSEPGKSSREGTTTINGRRFESGGVYSEGLLLSYLIDELH